MPSGRSWGGGLHASWSSGEELDPPVVNEPLPDDLWQALQKAKADAGRAEQAIFDYISEQIASRQ